MIAKNFIRFPEALRFQVEMFSNGYKNSPRIMRLMQVICLVKPTMPQWWKDLKRAENALIKKWKAAMIGIFSKPAAAEPVKKSGLPSCRSTRWQPTLNVNESSKAMRCGGTYRSFCRAHQGGYQGWARYVGPFGVYGAEAN